MSIRVSRVGGSAHAPYGVARGSIEVHAVGLWRGIRGMHDGFVGWAIIRWLRLRLDGAALLVIAQGPADGEVLVWNRVPVSSWLRGSSDAVDGLRRWCFGLEELEALAV